MELGGQQSKDNDMEEMSKWMEGEKVESSKRNGRKEKMYKIGRNKIQRTIFSLMLVYIQRNLQTKNWENRG